MSARETGLGPDEIRAPQFHPPAQMPCTTALGATYDSGDFDSVMRDALDAADWKGFPARRAASQRKPASCAASAWRPISRMLAAAAAERPPIAGSTTPARHPSSSATRPTARATRRPMRKSSRRGSASPSSTSARAGRHRHDARRHGTGGSRALSVAGAAIAGRRDKIIAKGKLAGGASSGSECRRHRLRRRRFMIVGTDRAHEHLRGRRPPRAPGIAGGRGARPRRRVHAHARSAPFPTAATSARSRSIPTTGTLEVVNYSVMDDFGMAINPLLLTGQVHGGAARASARR